MDVINFILSNKRPQYITTNKQEIRIRCPFCGDSKKDPKSAHLYIQAHPPYKFFCQKCNTSGALNQKNLKDMGLYDSELAVSVMLDNKLYKSTHKTQHITTKKYTNLFFPKIMDENNSAVQYFNSRYKTSYTGTELAEKFNAITEPLSFIYANHIMEPVGQYNVKDAIGFISSDNSHIIFRDISGQQKKRYFNLSLDLSDNSSKIYNIKTDINLMQDQLNLYITEGIFDIIGVYNGLDFPHENSIFAAACGKSFVSVISKYVRLGFLNLKVTIFSDADVSREFYVNQKSQCPFIKDEKIDVYYNTLEKDFGIPSDRIKIKKVVV